MQSKKGLTGIDNDHKRQAVGQDHVGKGKGVAMRRESNKKRIKEIERRLAIGEFDARNVSRVYWGPDELIDWYTPNGEIEKITADEYVARGGYLITWKDGD